ncbi:MAG: hypothetical protein K2Z81_05725 [Cyanobacteria bacterium]|nr:hypothetical protein [Cyanobacteriota bacterium]
MATKKKFSSDKPTSFTVGQFARKKNWSEEYVRQCCRGYIDRHGNKTQLPVGWNATKIAGEWRISRIGVSGAADVIRQDLELDTRQLVEKWNQLDSIVFNELERQSEPWSPERIEHIFRTLFALRNSSIPKPLPLNSYNSAIKLISVIRRLYSALKYWPSQSDLLLTIRIRPDGSSMIETVDCSPRQVCDPITVVRLKHGEPWGLLVLAWMIEVWDVQESKKQQTAKDTRSFAFSVISSLRICLHCGGSLGGKQKRYCGGQCVKLHGPWIQDRVNEPPVQMAKKLAERIDKLVQKD